MCLPFIWLRTDYFRARSELYLCLSTSTRTGLRTTPPPEAKRKPLEAILVAVWYACGPGATTEMKTRPVNRRAVAVRIKPALHANSATLAPQRATNGTSFGPYSPDSSVLHRRTLP
jgi:hypothetical protein